MAYLYLAKQVGIAGALALWAYIVAKGLFARSSLRLSFVQEVALLVPAGLGLAILLLFGLGIAGALTGPGILAGGGVVLALALWRLRGRMVPGMHGTVRALMSTVTPARVAMLAVAGTVLVPVALNALTPPLMSDEVRYHLPYALHFVEQGRIAPDLYLRFPFFALNVNLLYAAALVFGDDVTPHFVHLLLGSLAGLALYALAAPRFGRVTASCAVLLFFVTPNFARFATTAYIDLGLAVFVTSAIACLDRARGRQALAVCAGMAFGAALGTKYLALALLPLLVAWAAFRTRSGSQVVRFAVVAVLTGAPWYVYNFIWTGNPVSPFAGEWFGTWPWTAEDLVRQTRHLAKQGHDLSLAEILSLPYDLVSDSWRFSIPPVPVVLAAGLVALALLPWWEPDMRPYGAVVLVFVVAWFLTAAYFRYLTAILPLWCLVSVWSVGWILRPVVAVTARGTAGPAVTRRRASYVAGAIVLFLAEHHFWLHNRWLDAAALTERVVHRDRFLRERIPVYGVVEHLRRTGAQGEVVFAFPPGPLLSYVRMNRVVGDHFGPMGNRQTLLVNSLCQERLVERLQLKDVSLLVLSKKFLDRSPALNRYLGSRLASEYADQHATVFRIESTSKPHHEAPHQDLTDSLHADVTFGDDDVQVIPWFPIASDGFLQGAVRIVNHSDASGTVVIHGIDDAGRRYGPANLALGAREVKDFNSDDWVTCDLMKPVSGGPGDDEAGNWWMSLATDLDIEALSYVRTEDRFMTAVHEVARTTRGPGGETVHHVPFFNPGNEHPHASQLRLINPGHQAVDVTITGRDDAGETASEEVHLSLPAGAACWLSASVLESGAPDGGGSGCNVISGRLGNGQGRWRLSAIASGGVIQVMSLLTNPTGHLTNLSASVAARSGTYTLPLFIPVTDSNEELQGFARIVNQSDEGGTVEIRGIDDNGTSHGPVILALDRQEAVHLGSGDLETGNASKGLPEGLGDGEGYWRLRLATELDIEVSVHVRTEDGYVAPVHGVAGTTRGAGGEVWHYVPFFNPARNRRQVSWLRLSNSGPRDVEVTIEGRDRAGMEAPEGVVRLTLPAGQACTLSAQALESGKPESGADTCTGERFDLDGRFGVGAGKWSLFVMTTGGDVQVMSLLKSPSGYLSNLSVPNRAPTGRPASGTPLDALPDVTIVEVEGWGPRATGIGESFNVQPGENSALWFRFRELGRHPDYRIFVDSQPAATTMDAERNLITAGLTARQTRRLVSTEGKVPIHLVAPSRGKQLVGYFHVRPR